MSVRVAVVDLGTNTFHLLIADVSENFIEEIVYSRQLHVKLGEGGITTGLITDAAFRRGIDALEEFNQIISRYNTQEVRAVGTAALRAAKNGNDFIAEVKERTGIQIEIISGDREAS